MAWTRYAVYWLPGGALGRAGAAWLGWDARAGAETDGAGPDTDIPRRYGFHATVKPPFRLAPGRSEADLRDAARALAGGLLPTDLGILSVGRLGRFLALVPERMATALAASVVEGLDGYRAQAGADELARRRAAGLTPTQDALLVRWGYPHVMTEYRMHLTLTGPDPSDATQARARSVFGAHGGPHVIDSLSLVGEDAAGRFHLIDDLPFGGGHGTGPDSAARATPTA